MARTSPDAVHITYPDDPAAMLPDLMHAIQVHTSKDAALEHAVDVGHKYVPVRKGETLAAAIERYAADRTAKAKPAARRAIVDAPQA